MDCQFHSFLILPRKMVLHQDQIENKSKISVSGLFEDRKSTNLTTDRASRVPSNFILIWNFVYFATFESLSQHQHFSTEINLFQIRLVLALDEKHGPANYWNTREQGQDESCQTREQSAQWPDGESWHHRLPLLPHLPLLHGVPLLQQDQRQEPQQGHAGHPPAAELLLLEEKLQ